MSLIPKIIVRVCRMYKLECVRNAFISIISISAMILTQIVIAADVTGDKFGPFDYTNPERRGILLDVERAHYNSDVENLVKGITGSVWADTDYIIRIFPNHHRALYSMARLYRLQGKPIGTLPEKTIDYYFKRAIEHYPLDGMVYMIYGIHYQKINNHKKAESLYLKALEIQEDNIEAHYNLGLLYIELKKYSESRKHAVDAYNKGYPLQGLKNKLKKLGKWKRPVDAGK